MPDFSTPEETWEFTVPSGTLDEIKVMIILESFTNMVEKDELARALRWAIDRFEIDV